VEVQKMIQKLGVHFIQLDLSHNDEVTMSVLEANIKAANLVINLVADRGGTRSDGVRRLGNNPWLNTGVAVTIATLCDAVSVPMMHLSTDLVWRGEENFEEGYPPVEIGEDPRFLDETGSHPLYVMQKMQAEKGLLGYECVTILRCPVLYGAMLGSLEDGSASEGIANLLGKNDNVYNQYEVRYPTCADDVACVLGALARKRLNSGLQKRVYNYGAQKPVSDYAFMELFKQAVCLELELKSNDTDQSSENRQVKGRKLCIQETKAELLEEEDWHEPRNLDFHDVKTIWVPHFHQLIAQR